MRASPSGRARLIIGLLALALTLPVLAGCGRKGTPEPPEGTTYPRQYPSPTYQ